MVRGRKKTPENGGTSKSKTGIPPRPRWLSNKARAEYDRLVASMQAVGIPLEKVDRGIIECLAEAYADLRWARETIEDEGYVIESKQGTYPHPAVRIKQKSMELINKFNDQLGLSPMARQRMMLADDSEEDDLEAAMRGKPDRSNPGSGGKVVPLKTGKTA